ncbi:interferon gamma receptor 1 [Syngnathoides biaculeatus]|uniref:interferon gamma receptor 1 n=1 Tax=Syngnathoides biaculeatus TaxID=300417 RepID=UPI002ADE8264|nr:interferon gamma receptor 1 [Syngnathoides biaculeatus]
MLDGAAFMAFLILLDFARSAEPPVPPPTDVTVSCHNTTGSAHWRYDEDVEVRFLVYVGSSGSLRLQDVTSRRSYHNLSALAWDSLESVMDVHEVKVAAEAPDGRVSDNVSVSFTYNIIKMADVMCKLDFPPADMTANGEHATIRFRNPLRYYPELRHATCWDTVSVDVSAVSDAGVDRYSCPPENIHCNMEVSFPAGSVECVTLTGSVSDLVGRTVAFGTSPRICAQTSPVTDLALGLLLGVTFVFLVSVAVAIWKVMAWCAKATKEHLPKCLVPKTDFAARSRLLPNADSAALSATVETDNGSCAVAVVAVRDTQSVPPISQRDSDSSCVSTEMESLPVSEEEREEGQEEEEEDEDFVSNYDCHHVNFSVDLGGGENACGYTAR